MPSTYSSAQLRDRDEHIHKQCQEQLRAQEARFQRLRYSADATNKSLFDLQYRARRLAESLGYIDIADAQIAIDSSEYALTYQECFERLQMLEPELSLEKKESELARVTLQKIEKEKRMADAQLRELQNRYDELLNIKQRASERYKSDYKKWKNFYNSTFSDDPADRKQELQPGITSQERKKRDGILQRKRERLIAGNFAASIEPWDESNPQRISALSRGEKDDDKENEETPMPPSKKRRLDSENSQSPSKQARSPVKPRLPMQPLRDSLLRSVTNITAPSASPTVFLDKNDQSTRTPTPLAFRPLPDDVFIKREPSSTPSPGHALKLDDTPRSSPLSQSRIPGSLSSDTEDDSQAIYVPGTDARTGKPIVFLVPAPPPTAGPSKYGGLLPTATPHNIRLTLNFPQATPDKEPISNLSKSKALPLFTPATKELSDVASRRKYEENKDTLEEPTSGETSSAALKPRLKTFSSVSAKGKERELPVGATTPLMNRTTNQTRLDDYSTFKGRGRYGKQTGAQDMTSINAIYAINPTHNGGLDYQYDEVVRNREDRHKMDASDCECCREYYKSVGPLPARLQQPLWRSPPATPAKPCLRHSHSPEGINRNHSKNQHVGSRSVPRQSEIESHKKAISRHRHTWDRAATPPGYWDIGFPNTQEVGDINEKAKEMHKRKKDQVDREAAHEGGRYRRK